MTYREAVELLAGAGIEDAQYDARELFLAFGGARMPIRGDFSSDSPTLADAIRRRAEREPLQYIIGRVGFYREEYKVDNRCLIPRSDTEMLVDYAVKNIPEGALFLDLCTGSGCVAVSTLKNTRGTRCVAVDISSGALEIAGENAELNGVLDRLELRSLDLLGEGEELVSLKPYAVLSNPPYVADSVYEGLEGEIFHEPRGAFVGGEDGGDFYRRLLPLFAGAIAEGGFIAFEIGYDQAPLARSLAQMYSLDLEIIKDLGGNDRVAVYRKRDSL